MYRLKFLAHIFIVLLLLGCEFDSENPSQSEKSLVSKLFSNGNDFSVTGVNDFQFLFNETEIGGIINFKSSDFQQCTLAFKKAKFVQGFEASVSIPESGDFDVTCLSDKDNYFINENENTYAKIRIDEVSQQAKITLSFSLIGYNSEKLVTRENFSLVVNKKQLESLLTQ